MKGNLIFKEKIIQETNSNPLAIALPSLALPYAYLN